MLNEMNMKLLVLIVLTIPAISIAECNIKSEEIKPNTKKILEPLHDSFNLFITEDEFRVAHKQIVVLLDDVSFCRDELGKRVFIESERTDILKEMEIYSRYSSGLRDIEMQLKAGYESFELGLFRPLLFETGMWESVANEFYEKQI